MAVPVELHLKWESETHIRARARVKHCLLDWPEPRLVGAPSKRAFAMNKLVLEKVAEWWCPQKDLPQTVSIDLVRAEVSHVKTVYDSTINVFNRFATSVFSPKHVLKV